jgi:hypothetical protein
VRLDVLVLAVFGGPAALIAGRELFRVIPSALFLFFAITVQFGFAAILWSQGPGCGSPAGDLTFALIFIIAVLRGFAIPAAVTLVAAPVFVYGVLARTSALVRMLVVAALLLAVGDGVLFAGQHMQGAAVHRCADFCRPRRMEV